MSTQEREGEFFIVASAILWGLFPVVAVLSFRTLSPIVSLGWSTVIASAFFAIVMSVRARWHELRRSDAWFDMLMGTVVSGIVYYVFLFLGLRLTSPTNASIIGLTEVLSSYLFYTVWKGEHFSSQSILGAILVMTGAFIVLYPNHAQPNLGDVLVLCSTLIAPIGSYYQRRARKSVSSETMMFVRSFIVCIACLASARMLRFTWTFSDVYRSLAYLLVNGILLLGVCKIFWIESIHRISVTKANALSSINPLITMVASAFFLALQPTFWQLLSIFPMVAGVMLLSSRPTPLPAQILYD